MRCPKCGLDLGVVRGNPWLNDEQWDAVKPGDYYRQFDACLSDDLPCVVSRIGGNWRYRYAFEVDLARYNDAEARRRGWE